MNHNFALKGILIDSKTAGNALALATALSCAMYGLAGAAASSDAQNPASLRLDIYPVCDKGTPGFRVTNTGMDFSERAVFSLKAERSSITLLSRTMRLKRGQSASFHAATPRLPSGEPVHLHIGHGAGAQSPEVAAKSVCFAHEDGITDPNRFILSR